jgi:cobalt/nickel transport system permease protein
MHMADALVSPAVGGTLWAASAGVMAWCSRKMRRTLDDKSVPLMAVLGAFIFAAQMINFQIPLTGSSGHLGGGMILAILLGPHAAFVVIASVLTVQALFFADGGLLALGCNIVNLGFVPAFIAYPLIFKPITTGTRGGSRLWIGAMLASIAALQLGAFGVVIETTLSGISDLPFRSFVLLMQPIHLAIGIVEGLVTASVVSFVLRTRPADMPVFTPNDTARSRRTLIGLMVAAIVMGGGLSWFASTQPDGLEWAMGKASSHDHFEHSEEGIHKRLASLQETTSFLPDYGFKAPESQSMTPPSTGSVSWPSVNAGTTVAGIVGGALTLALAGIIGYGLKRRTAS